MVTSRLTRRRTLSRNPRVRFAHQLRSSTTSAALVALATSSLIGFAGLQAAVPYNQATVTRLQNKVTYGEGAAAARRPARSGDIIRSENYLLTETDSRAELKYVDGTIVRIGQNTVFTFEADTRTLTLEKGSLIFHIPKGSGGGTIRTASITAAITGTTGKVSETLIAILEGEVTLVPSGKKVGAGSFAQANPDGSISVRPFDPSTAGQGVLMNFNGPMPGFNEAQLTRPAIDSLPPFNFDESLDRTQNHPRALRLRFPDIFNPRTRVIVPPPRRGGDGGPLY